MSMAAPAPTAEKTSTTATAPIGSPQSTRKASSVASMMYRPCSSTTAYRPSPSPSRMWPDEIGAASMRRLTPRCLVSMRAADPVSAVRYMNSTSWDEAPRSNRPRSANSAVPTVEVSTVTGGSRSCTARTMPSAVAGSAPAVSATKPAARSTDACDAATAPTVVWSWAPTPPGRAANPIVTGPPARIRAS